MGLMDAQRDGVEVRRWGMNLPYLLPVIVLAALAVAVYAGGVRILSTAEALAQEDAALLNWWHVDQRDRLSDQAAMLAERLRASDNPAGDLAAIAAEIGLAEHSGYIAWIDGEKQEKAVLNPGAVVGAPAASKLFSFAPAVGRPSSDFWQEDGQVLWMAMAPVAAELGGGVVVIQQPITDETLAALAALTERDVVLYSYEEKAPLLSSDPALLRDPPRLSAAWMEKVATGQLPDSTRARNSQNSQIVGMIAFPDFAAISYSGYLALIEPGPQVSRLLPTGLYWGVVALAVLLMALGAWLLRRSLLSFLQNYSRMDYRTRRRARVRMVLLMLLFLLPSLLAAGFIVFDASNRTALLDARTAQIAKGVLRDTADSLADRINLFAEDDTARTLPAESPEALAGALQRAHGLEFAFVPAAEGVAQAALEELSPQIIEAVSAVSPGAVDVVHVGRTAILAAAQPGPGGSTAYAGVRLSKWLPRVLEFSGADLTILNGTLTETEVVASTLAEREIESLYFDEAVEAELASSGEASYLQKVGWNPGRLTLFPLDFAGGETWRLIISQASVTWSNSVRAYQGLSFAFLGLALVLVLAVLLTVLNLDKPLLLRRMYTGYFFILPAVVWLVWWQLGPALFTGYLSFHKWSVLSPAKPFVGLHNYRQLMQDDVFWNAMKNTFVYVTQIPLGMALALALALALNRPLKGIKALRTIYYMPAVTSIVVVSLMWKLLYNKDLGIFNYLLSFVGLGPYGFLQSTTMALPSIMAMAVWLGLGARMILFLAGLQSISDDYYEAADVDGANGWAKFRHITIPLLAPTTFFVFITSIIGSFQVFGPIYVLTEGGPAGASDVAVHRIYFEAWQNLRFGYASAETVILFAFLFVVTAIQFRYFGRNVSYG